MNPPLVSGYPKPKRTCDPLETFKSELLDLLLSIVSLIMVLVG
tara:strand:- start:1749 stop:1877 length:129 start_codon:yes stop_codon:yes gene_type:complete